jgi:hypothetical protein
LKNMPHEKGLVTYQATSIPPAAEERRLPGVTQHGRKWRAQARISGKVKDLGLFDTQDKARREVLKHQNKAAA